MKIAEAETEAADAASAFKRIEAEQKAALHALLGETDLTPDRWEDARAVAASKTEGATAASAYAGGRVLALRERAGELAERIGAERVAEAEAALRTLASAVAEAEERLGLVRAQHEAARLALEDVQDEAVALRADFTPELASARDARRSQDRELARWHAANLAADAQIPRHLLALVEQERERLEAQSAADRRRMHEEARASRLKAGYTE